jgi:hypothetical protein
MALSSGSKKSTQSDSDSDSDDEVRDELPFLRHETERLGSLLDNRDDMLREAKKKRKELRASLEDARTRVVELETQVLDSKLEIDSLTASPVVSDEVDCADCTIFLAEGPIRRTREGGSEWEPIKILLEGNGNSNKMNTASNTRLRLTTKVGQAHVATGVPLDLGTNTPPSDPRNAAEKPNLESTDPQRSDR